MKPIIFNEDDSTNGICDHCHIAIQQCECEDITCQKCEDGMPRRHKCTAEAAICEHCGEPPESCECTPSGHYDS